MTGHQYLSMINHWTLGILNVILNYLFLITFGIIGAAVATALVLATINIIRLIEVWSFERLFPYDLSFVKPLSAGLLVTPIFYLSKMHLSGLFSLIIGGLVGFCFYFGVLFLLGLEKQDQELIDRIRS
jgi:O-antigen/teichoic acid export membrane protein